MASTTSLYTGLSGLQAHARMLDVVSNNITNVSTTAFKSSRVAFETQLTRTLKPATPPRATSGGTNPTQVGLGVRVSGTQRNFGAGSLAITGDQRDLAIDGDGFFMVERDGQRYYTRDGSFRPDLENNLVLTDGSRLLGYGVDENFAIDDTSVVPITAAVGTVSVAEATTEVVLAGNLNGGSDDIGAGSVTELNATATSGFGLISTATVPPTAPNLLEPTSLLTEIVDPVLGDPAPLMLAGQSIRLTGATKGGKTLPDAALPITAASTVQDLLDFLNASLGIHATGPDPLGNTPGATLDPTTGTISVVGNPGVDNSIELEQSDLRLHDALGLPVRSPFLPTQVGDGTGESGRTTMVVYDSLGTEVDVDITFVLDSKPASGTVWRYYLDSADDQAGGPAVGTGLISFDPDGVLVTSSPILATIDRTGTGAVDPLAFSISLGSGPREFTGETDEESTLFTKFRDGTPIGTMDAFSIGEDGQVIGAFTNGLTRTIGRVLLAEFSPQEGLEEVGRSKFVPTAASGQPRVVTPGGTTTSTLIAGSLEQSNVDLGQEFIDLILTSTGYTASSRVIRTADELMQQLLVLGR